MERARGDAAPIQFIHLIFHQRDQRRYDDRRARQRECRQLVVWSGDLARQPGARRATILAEGGQSRRSIRGSPNVDPPAVSDVRGYLFEPDPAVLAARLEHALAAEHDLSLVQPGVAYFTADRLVDDAALARFAVLDVMPCDVRRLTAALAERNIGCLEIKKRGVDLDPARRPTADELLIYPQPGIREGEERYVLAFGIPTSTAGLRLICREPFATGSQSEWDHPLGARFEEPDAVCVFDDVLIPWERVFLYNDVTMGNDLQAAADDAGFVAARGVSNRQTAT